MTPPNQQYYGDGMLGRRSIMPVNQTRYPDGMLNQPADQRRGIMPVNMDQHRAAEGLLANRPMQNPGQPMGAHPMGPQMPQLPTRPAQQSYQSPFPGGLGSQSAGIFNQYANSQLVPPRGGLFNAPQMSPVKPYGYLDGLFNQIEQAINRGGNVDASGPAGFSKGSDQFGPLAGNPLQAFIVALNMMGIPIPPQLAKGLEVGGYSGDMGQTNDAPTGHVDVGDMSVVGPADASGGNDGNDGMGGISAGEGPGSIGAEGESGFGPV